mgnify:CR=1 FL=1
MVRRRSQDYVKRYAEKGVNADLALRTYTTRLLGADPKLVLAECDYGGLFCAAIARGRCFATQFHPEKSQARGLQIYRNFTAVAAKA